MSINILPRDIKLKLLDYILINLNYKDFIEASEYYGINEELWKIKGIKDFVEINNEEGNTFQSKYLRASAKRVFYVYANVLITESMKIHKTIIHSKYIHKAKSLDFKGKYDNYYHFKYYISYEEKLILEKSNRRQYIIKYIPKNCENWIVFIIYDKFLYALRGNLDRKNFHIYSYININEINTFNYLLRQEFGSNKKASEIYGFN